MHLLDMGHASTFTSPRREGSACWSVKCVTILILQITITVGALSESALVSITFPAKPSELSCFDRSSDQRETRSFFFNHVLEEFYRQVTTSIWILNLISATESMQIMKTFFGGKPLSYRGRCLGLTTVTRRKQSCTTIAKQN